MQSYVMDFCQVKYEDSFEPHPEGSVLSALALTSGRSLAERSKRKMQFQTYFCSVEVTCATLTQEINFLLPGLPDHVPKLVMQYKELVQKL